jgi:hypothetical protein
VKKGPPDRSNNLLFIISFAWNGMKMLSVSFFGRIMLMFINIFVEAPAALYLAILFRV